MLTFSYPSMFKSTGSLEDLLGLSPPHTQQGFNSSRDDWWAARQPCVL